MLLPGGTYVDEGGAKMLPEGELFETEFKLTEGWLAPDPTSVAVKGGEDVSASMVGAGAAVELCVGACLSVSSSTGEFSGESAEVKRDVVASIVDF